MLSLIRCPFQPLLPQWHVKDPRQSAKSAGGRLHLNMHTSLTQQSQSGLTMLLSRNNVGNFPKKSSHATCQETFWTQSSELTEPLWTNPNMKEWNKCVRANLRFKKRKSAGGNEWSNNLSKSSLAREQTPPWCDHLW